MLLGMPILKAVLEYRDNISALSQFFKAQVSLNLSSDVRF